MTEGKVTEDAVAAPTTKAGKSLLDRVAGWRADASKDPHWDAKYHRAISEHIANIEAEARHSDAAEVERLRTALTEFVQWADDGEDDDGIVARGKAALSSTEAVK
jgi:DNA-binding FadR family transcriptional regulator